MYSFSPLPCDLSVQRRGKEVVHSDVTPVRGLLSSTACHTFERVGEGEGDLHWGRSYNFCRISPEQFCSHGSQRPMKPLSKEYIIRNAQAISLVNLQSLGRAANEDTVKEMRLHSDREHGK